MGVSQEMGRDSGLLFLYKGLTDDIPTIRRNITHLLNGPTLPELTFTRAHSFLK